MNKTHDTIQLTQTGVVMHAAGKTARVKVARTRIHPLYQKRYTVHSQLQADIPEGVTVKIGDTVTVKPTRRLSKSKFWVVMGGEK